MKFERLSDADYDPAGQLLTLTGVTAEGSRAEVSLSAQSPDQFIAWLVGSIQRDGQGNSAVLSDKIGFSMVENPDHGGPILLFQIYFAGRPISFGVPLPKSVGRQQIQTIGEQFQTALALVERLSSSAN